MRQLYAILWDSYRESVDRRSLFVALGLAALAIIFCFSISFDQQQPGALLEKQVEELGTFRRQSFQHQSSSGISVDVEVVEQRALSESDGLAELLPGHMVVLQFPSEREICELALRYEHFYRRGDFNFDEEELEQAMADPRTAPRFLRKRFKREGWKRVEVERLQGEAERYRVAVATDRLNEVRGAHRASFLFGLIKRDVQRVSEAEVVIGVQTQLVNSIVGIIGVLIAILSCSGFIPTMLRKGSLDLVLARPIGRMRLLLFKYLGGLWFVLILAAFLIGGCWLALGMRTGYWSPWFLVTIPIVTGIFAVLYTVVTLIGVLTRSATVSALIGVGVWWFSSIIVQIRAGLQVAMKMDGDAAPSWVNTTLDSLYAILPKTTDFTFLNTTLLMRSNLSSEAYEAVYQSMLPDVNWLFSIGTTCAFSAVMLALALWRFTRKDY